MVQGRSTSGYLRSDVAPVRTDISSYRLSSVSFYLFIFVASNRGCPQYPGEAGFVFWARLNLLCSGITIWVNRRDFKCKCAILVAGGTWYIKLYKGRAGTSVIWLGVCLISFLNAMQVRYTVYNLNLTVWTTKIVVFWN